MDNTKNTNTNPASSTPGTDLDLLARPIVLGVDQQPATGSTNSTTTQQLATLAGSTGYTPKTGMGGVKP